MLDLPSLETFGTEVQFWSDHCQLTCCVYIMWLWRVTVAFAFFHYNSQYKVEVLSCVVDMCFAK